MESLHASSYERDPDAFALAFDGHVEVASFIREQSLRGGLGECFGPPTEWS
jgi:hypothetical protein